MHSRFMASSSSTNPAGSLPTSPTFSSKSQKSFSQQNKPSLTESSRKDFVEKSIKQAYRTILSQRKLFIPPINFSLVMPGIYRSGFPTSQNFNFIQSIGLKTVIYLSPEKYPEGILKFMTQNNVTMHRFSLPPNKLPYIDIDSGMVASSLVQILDKRNQPMLIHCNKGIHRTGCVVGCLRKLQNWSLTSIFDEYRRFAAIKGRILDQQYIELFDPTTIRYNENYLPQWFASQDKFSPTINQKAT